MNTEEMSAVFVSLSELPQVLMDRGFSENEANQQLLDLKEIIMAKTGREVDRLGTPERFQEIAQEVSQSVLAEYFKAVGDIPEEEPTPELRLV